MDSVVKCFIGLIMTNSTIDIFKIFRMGKIFYIGILVTSNAIALMVTFHLWLFLVAYLQVGEPTIEPKLL